MVDISTLTIAEAKRLLSQKVISARELTELYLDRIKKLEHLNAFLTVATESALAEAEQADKKIAQGDELPLLGIPIALKDMYLTKGLRTTAASKVLENFIPAFDATAVQKLKDAGAIILGKNNQDAWAHGSSGENSDFGPTLNPWDTKYVPGGSSSGPAAAVAADLCLAAGGTDTGGSIRQPASFCNIVGLKPTYGRVSRYGVVAMASSLDTIGHFTKTIEDSALYLQVTAGKDKNDATTSPIGVPNYLETIKNSIKGLRIGIPREYFTKGLDNKVEHIIRQALKTYEDLGAKLVEVSLPHTEYANPCYYIVMSSEVSSNLARYDGIRYGNNRETFGDEAKRRIMLGTFTLSAGYYDAYYKKAMAARAFLRQDFEDVWKDVDIVAAPISPTLPWRLGEKVDDPLAMYLSDIFTITTNLVGIPGLSVPVGFSDRLPVGMQLLGPHFSEAKLFQAGYAYEQVNKWYTHKPQLLK